MGRRLTGFDYSRPYFYMVTMKCVKGAQKLSEIAAPGKCQLNAITRAFVGVIRHFHEACPVIAQIGTFTIMPDHIHLIIKITEANGRRLNGDGVQVPLRLEAIVEMLMQALEGAYREVTGIREAVFDARWHDWIVLEKGQLAAFTRYIHDNPMRAFIRSSHREYFQRVNEVEFLGRKWYGYGNAALLSLPVLEQFRCSRKWAEGGEEWRGAVARAERIGSGGAGVSTFMSPCEKACGRAIGVAGGKWIVLSPEGFGERWHPGREYEKFCAEGRMLFLSLWPAMAREPTRAELYDRCHLMGDIAAEGLGSSRTNKESSRKTNRADSVISTATISPMPKGSREGS